MYTCVYFICDFLNEYSMGNILNDRELINLHTVKWFQVLLLIILHTVQRSKVLLFTVCTQLNCLKYRYLLFAHSDFKYCSLFFVNSLMAPSIAIYCLHTVKQF